MNIFHNNHLISNGKELKHKGVMVRKWDYNDKGVYHNPTKKNLNKQIKTLHSKIKKNDIVYTEYSIEKDKYDNKYHIHMIVNYTNEQNLNDILSNYIGGNEWINREVGLDTFNECNGKYGLIHTEDIIDINQYRSYINKTNTSTNLI
jgi:hypothetical protein